MNQNIITRFAPSPTGYLHVGGLRTALFNYLFIKKNNGKFILRIEDTDRERYVKGAEEDIKKTLKDFGLNWDEECKQSERLDIYKKYAKKLISENKAYKEDGAVRFQMPKTKITEFADLVHGQLQFKNEIFKDPIILKSDGYPVYNFANVIDDHEMGITHVIRGEEFLPSTPIHIQIYRALGWEPPKFVHLPLILDRERKKLSKRTGDVAVKEYIEKGYLPEAILNFIAFLGWNPKTQQEIFSLPELIEQFSIEKINKSGAIFDIQKLDYINRQWQKRLGRNPLFEKAIELEQMRLKKFDMALFEIIWPQVQERTSGPSDLAKKLPEFDFYFVEPEYDVKLLIWKDATKEKIKSNLQILQSFIEKNKKNKLADIQNSIFNILKEQGIGTGEALWPLRVALTGLRASPSPFEIIESFLKIPHGHKNILQRIQNAIDKL